MTSLVIELVVVDRAVLVDNGLPEGAGWFVDSPYEGADLGVDDDRGAQAVICAGSNCRTALECHVGWSICAFDVDVSAELFS